MSRIFKRGKSWYVDFVYKGKGKRHRQSLGTHSKQVAKLHLKNLDVMIDTERLDLKSPEKVDFDDFAYKFLEWYEVQNSEKSYRDYWNLFNNTLIPYFAKIKLTDITIEMLEIYKRKRRLMISASTVNKELIALKHLLNKAILSGHLNTNPVREVSKLKVKQKKFRFLTREEVQVVLAAAPASVKPIFLTAIQTGLRKSELFGLSGAILI